MALCKICGSTDETLFYDSIKTYCKEHWKERVRANRVANIEHYRAFEKMRGLLPHRIAAAREYQKTDAGKESVRRSHEKWKSDHPERRAAHIALGNALRDGKIQKLPCVICGSLDVEAHHPSYDHPLVVTWLCVEHHKEVHWHMKEAA